MSTSVCKDRSVSRSSEGKVSGAYEKPVFEKQAEMVFPMEVIEAFNGGRFCVQCSSCHGCH